mmetsp:Transcript_102693/g.314123  ORF Transcript_102693/g.314123 Transcript_102693/m.314123 type:complete len:416 (-) Transcript_102693:95-1342(-)|eukprot:CAMPEP_0198539118 /NCGR_PEP_ID=MMETSP1462-20131121/48240_1 /TAXON_ID=1333877 /ORGANISM="Brandtodinium nutriculum, Strain RCC3387" /LENGTH=415 /DNA_ID=CAMNT_0044269163 /DNA_START=34 /DNA_END=1281 /DNA_ORIENTATION=-
MDGVVLEIDSDVEVVIPDAFSIELAKQLQAEDCRALQANEADRLPRESEPYPPLPDPADSQASAERAKTAAQLRHQTESEAAAALAANDVQKAVDVYTLAMRTGGATAMMLANRAALLLKQRRPCAAIRDCTAALKINASMVKAYRVRAIAHHKLGHFRKAYSDVSEAQTLKYDDATSEMQKALAAQCDKLDGVVGKHRVISPEAPKAPKEDRDHRRAAAPPRAESVEVNSEAHFEQEAQPPEHLKDLDKGQAVVLSGLQKAPHLNGRRGVIERADPRPANKGRWEVEVRMDGGKLEIKSIKRENIKTLNKADRAACKAWAAAEKQHKEQRRSLEEQEELKRYRNCVDAKMSKLPINETMRAVLRKIRPQDALSVLDKVDGSRISDVNEFLNTQVKLLTEQSDSDDEPAVKRSRA